MSPLSRRALLAAAATGSAGALAGCGALPSLSSDADTPTPGGLGGRTVYAADVPLPDDAGVRTVDDPAAADVAAFPAGDSSVAPATDALAAGTPVAVAGEDAQWTATHVCDADGRSYGLSSDAWGPNTRVVAVTPSPDHLLTHRFVGVGVPADLPWVLAEVVSPTREDCTLPAVASVVPDGVESGAALAGVCRTLGRNDVAGFDRWDRVRTAAGDGWTAAVVDVAATVLAGSEVSGGDDRYHADGVRLVAEFEASLDGVAPAARTAAGLRVENRSDPTTNAARHAYSPTTDAARRSFTACQRSYLTADEMPRPFSYTANVRFRWRDPRLLDDDRWTHHTPGRAVWYP